ncbi:uncharacterized protein LOC144882791 [Branchiostoma floridae x Branchiostoma japonicum]
MAKHFFLFSILIVMICASCFSDLCPNCRVLHSDCGADKNGPHNVFYGETLFPQCVICVTAPEHGGRSIIPACPAVERASSLRLRNFSLGYLSSSDVGHLKHLQNLYIEQGNLVSLENDTFAGFQSLQRLSLRRNQLTYLGTRWLVQTYRHLNLAHNQIAHIEDEAFGAVNDGCLMTKAILLPWNKLEVIRPDYFRHLCVLTMLDLRYNNIHTIHKGSFNEAYRLRIIRLADNNLRVVTTDWFPPIENERLLSRLDLAQNQIEYIEPEAFLHVPFLETIGLSDNRITSLHEHQLKLQYTLKFACAFESLTVTLHGNPIRCTCALRWFIKLGRRFNPQSDFSSLTCSYPQDLEATKLSHFTSAMIASMQCPAPKATISALDDGQTFRCEICWEKGPPKLIKWTLPNDTNLVITNVSFGIGTQVSLDGINTTTAFYMNPEGFDCCHPKALPTNHSASSTDHCNFVGKTLSYVTISEHLMNEWLGKDLTCTPLFLSEGANITDHHNVSILLHKTPLSSSIRTSIPPDTTKREDEEIFVLLNSEQNPSATTKYTHDLLITGFLTSSVLALVTFLFTTLRMTLKRKGQENANPEDDTLSQHTYEAVDDQPPLNNQYEVIADDQVEDDVITPYAQVTEAIIYGMDPHLPTTGSARDSTNDAYDPEKSDDSERVTWL